MSIGVVNIINKLTKKDLAKRIAFNIKLIYRFSDNYFYEEYQPTVFESYEKQVQVDFGGNKEMIDLRLDIII